MATTGNNQEQSVDDILASIRQMMTDETNDPKRPASRMPQPSEDDVLVLTEIVTDDGTIVRLKRTARRDDMAQDDTVSSAGAQVIGQHPDIAGKPVTRVAVAMAELHKAGMAPNGKDRATLLSEATAEAAVASFSELNRVVGEKEKAGLSTQTVDGLVRDAIQPLLQQWLNDNLPQIVERIVRDEIQRITHQIDRSN